jgi:D-3-phosphoglycerate dehydrogenase
MDNVDLKAVDEKGIKVFKTKTNPAPAVAELVLGLMIDVVRNISKSSYELKKGEWKKHMGSLLQGKTLGIIGLGNIGKALVKLVRGFGFKVIAYDLFQDEDFMKEYDITYCELNTLMQDSDIISLHLSLSDKTQKLVNKDRLALMKQDAILINTSRGEIIDEEALFAALKSNKLAGAGLDVFEQEPYTGPLTELNNIVITPHIGAYAKEIRNQMEIEAAENLIRGLNK